MYNKYRVPYIIKETNLERFWSILYLLVLKFLFLMTLILRLIVGQQTLDSQNIDGNDAVVGYY